MKAIRNSKGFTLMEMIVVLGVLALLTAILAPIILDYVEDARKTKAKADVSAIKAALFKLHMDTEKWPNDVLDPDVDCLVSERGNLPASANCGNNDKLEDHLMDNTAVYPTIAGGKIKWKGSYIDNIDSDPWGNAYVVYISAVDDDAAGTHAWVLSAGPDGAFDTQNDESKLQDDDIGVKIR